MKTLALLISGIVLCFFAQYGIMYHYNHQVRQEVVENEHTTYDFMYMADNMSHFSFKSYRRNDASIDSVIYKEFKTAQRIQMEADRIWYAPYKLITSYNHHEVVDYGDAKYIDSIKCIRFNQMLKERVTYDKQDSVDAVYKDMIEQAKERAEDELDRLNEKSCK